MKSLIVIVGGTLIQDLWFQFQSLDGGNLAYDDAPTVFIGVKESFGLSVPYCSR
jgi:hypothetical protein